MYKNVFLCGGQCGEQCGSGLKCMGRPKKDVDQHTYIHTCDCDMTRHML